MVALIDHRSTAQHDAADWAEGRPGWRCLRLSHRSWGKEVERLLNYCASDSAEPVRGVLELIDGWERFVWINSDRARLE